MTIAGDIALERIANALEFFVELQKAQAIAQAQPQPAAGSCPACGAPEDKQAEAGTLADPGRKKCLLCNAEYS